MSLVIYIKFNFMRSFFILTALALILSTPLLGQDEVPSFEDTLEVYQDLFGVREPLMLTLKFSYRNVRMMELMWYHSMMILKIKMI